MPRQRHVPKATASAFNHYFKHITTDTAEFQNAVEPLLTAEWSFNAEQLIATTQSFAAQIPPDAYLDCIQATKDYLNGLDFGVPGRFETKWSLFGGGLEYRSITPALVNLNKALDSLMVAIPTKTTTWSETLGSIASSLLSAASYGMEHPKSALTLLLCGQAVMVSATAPTSSNRLNEVLNPQGGRSDAGSVPLSLMPMSHPQASEFFSQVIPGTQRYSLTEQSMGFFEMNRFHSVTAGYSVKYVDDSSQQQYIFEYDGATERCSVKINEQLVAILKKNSRLYNFIKTAVDAEASAEQKKDWDKDEEFKRLAKEFIKEKTQILEIRPLTKGDYYINSLVNTAWDLRYKAIQRDVDASSGAGNYASIVMINPSEEISEENRVIRDTRQSQGGDAQNIIRGLHSERALLASAIHMAVLHKWFSEEQLSGLKKCVSGTAAQKKMPETRHENLSDVFFTDSIEPPLQLLINKQPRAQQKLSFVTKAKAEEIQSERNDLLNGPFMCFRNVLAPFDIRLFTERQPCSENPNNIGTGCEVLLNSVLSSPNHHVYWLVQDGEGSKRRLMDAYKKFGLLMPPPPSQQQQQFFMIESKSVATETSQEEEHRVENKSI